MVNECMPSSPAGMANEIREGSSLSDEVEVKLNNLITRLAGPTPTTGENMKQPEPPPLQQLVSTTCSTLRRCLEVLNQIETII